MAVAGVQHHWAVTRGNNPDTKPYYCPLHEARHGAAVALYRRLLQPIPDNATDHWARLADQAVAVSYTHLTLPTIALLCRSRWSPYH